MSKKKEIYEDIEEEELEEEAEDLEDDEEDDLDDEHDHDLNDDEIPSNPMGLAHYINKESETVKYFKELPKEVRFSFLEKEEKGDIKHFARSYRNWNYVQKIIDLRQREDKMINKTSVKDILNREDLVKYFEDENRHYLISSIDEMKIDELRDLLLHIKKINPDYYLDTFEKTKDDIDNLYFKYSEDNQVPKEIDDMDNLGKVADTSIASMGYKGNAPQHAVMTISAVKNEDVNKVAQEKSKFALLDTIKRKFG